jgi:hypothetical protein
MSARRQIIAAVSLMVFAVSGCAQSEPQTLEVTREVPQTVVATQVVEKVVKETVEVTRLVEKVVTATSAPPATTPSPVSTATAPTESQLGTVHVDQWELVITRVESLPARDTGHQMVVIFGNLTNHGSEGTFTPYYTLELADTKGRRYTDDVAATANARDRYGIEPYAGTSVPPESTEEVLYAFVAPAEERTFTIVPGDLVSSWSGNITFSLP